jgi:hypothetical protein
MADFLENVVRAGAGLRRGVDEAVAPQGDGDAGSDEEAHETQPRTSPAAGESKPPDLAEGHLGPRRSVPGADAEPSAPAPALPGPGPREAAPEPPLPPPAPQPPPARPPMSVAAAPEASIARTPAPAASVPPAPAFAPSEASGPPPAAARAPAPPVAPADRAPPWEPPAPSARRRAEQGRAVDEPVQEAPMPAPRRPPGAPEPEQPQPPRSPRPDARADLAPTPSKPPRGRVSAETENVVTTVVREERSTATPRPAQTPPLPSVERRRNGKPDTDRPRRSRDRRSVEPERPSSRPAAPVPRSVERADTPRPRSSVDVPPVPREPPPVEVRIGAVEVRLGEPADPAPQPQPTSGPTGFDEYASVRGYA